MVNRIGDEDGWHGILKFIYMISNCHIKDIPSLIFCSIFSGKYKIQNMNPGYFGVMKHNLYDMCTFFIYF